MFTAFLCASLAACHTGNGPGANNQKEEQDFKVADSSGPPQNIPMVADGGNLPTKADWDRKIVKTAHLTAVVKNHAAFSKTLEETLQRYNGYISSEEESKTESQVQDVVVLKIPVDRFESAVNDLLSDVLSVREKQITSDDVTTEMTDGKARLEAKRQVRLQYLELLKQAKNMADILSVQRELNAMQEEIEAVSGRISVLQHTAAMSTIQLTYIQELQGASTSDDTGFSQRLKAALVGGLRWFETVFIFLASIWPFVFLLTIAYVFRKKIGFK